MKSLNRARPFSLFKTDSFNLFEDFDDFFSDSQDYFGDSFDFDSSFCMPAKKRLKKKLKKTQYIEESIQKEIDQSKLILKELRNYQNKIDKKKGKIMKQIEELNKNSSKSENNSPESESRVFKNFYYKTPEIEIEEQYDSTDPKKCYKIVKKQGEAPQILHGDNNYSQITNTVEQDEMSKEGKEVLDKNLEKKLNQLSKLTNKHPKKLNKLVKENPDKTIGQLYDLAMSQSDQKQNVDTKKSSN